MALRAATMSGYLFASDETGCAIHGREPRTLELSGAKYEEALISTGRIASCHCFAKEDEFDWRSLIALTSSIRDEQNSRNCRCTYAPPFQDGDSEVALTLPGKVMHVRALCSGLASIRPSLLYVKHALEDHHHDMDWTIFQDTVARELTMASMFLGGILDGCVIAEMQQSIDKGGPAAPKRSVSFQGTMFQDATLRNIQEGVNGLRSFYFEEQSVQASLWTVINSWKHYFPYQPLPTEFSRGRLDFQLVLDSNHAALDTGIPESKDSLNSKPLSGPVVHDLLIPAFNAACGITARLVEIYAVSGNHTIDQIKNM
eukprot:gene13077-biopygen2949